MKTDPALLTHQPRPLRLVSLVGWCVLLGLGLALLFQRAWSAGQISNDFCQDYIAARWVLQGLSPYQPLRSWPAYATCTVPLNYDSHPPFSVLLVLPFGALPLRAALESWSFICLAAYLLSGLLLLRILGWLKLSGIALFVFLSTLWSPLSVAIGTENFAPLTTLLLAGIWSLERQGKERGAGIVLGLAGLLKLWPLILWLPALLRHRTASLLSGSVTILGGTLLTLPLLGLGAYATYLGPVRLEETTTVPHEVNMSVEGAVARLWTGYRDPSVVTFPPVWSGLQLSEAVWLGEGVAALLIVSTVALVVWALRRAQSAVVEALCQGLLVSVLLLGFPITWNWGLITFLFPLATIVVALQAGMRPHLWWYGVWGVGLLVLVNPLWLPLALAQRWPQWGGFLFGLPTLGLLLLVLAEALLLCWAVTRPAAAADAVRSAALQISTSGTPAAHLGQP